MVLDGHSFGFTPVTYQGPIFMTFGRYFMGFCIVIRPGMCGWGDYYEMVFRRLSFGFPQVIHQVPLIMSFGRYFMCLCLIFLPVMYLGALCLIFGWYLVCWFILFTCLLWFRYRQVDFHTLPVYHISSVSILSYCYSTVCASLPVACEVYLVVIRVWISRSNSCSGI